MRTLDGVCRLSIIIPVFNVENYVMDCLGSLYCQDLCENDFEVIIVNDGSTDGSMQLVKRMAQNHSNIRIYNQKNLGPSAARNLAIKNSIGKYLLFIDSDDFLLPKKISLLLKIAEDQNLELLRADYLNCDEQGNIVKKKENIHLSRSSYANTIIDGSILFSRIFDMEFFTPLLLLNRKFILENNLFFEEGIYFEDVDFSTRLSFVVRRAMFVPIIFYVYRLRQNSITHTIDLKKAKDLVYVINKLWNWLQYGKFGDNMTDAVLQNITHLSTYLFIRLAEPKLYQKKEEVLTFYKLKFLPIKGSAKEMIIAFIYNIMGKFCIACLHPFVCMKLKLKKLRNAFG